MPTAPTPVRAPWVPWLSAAMILGLALFQGPLFGAIWPRAGWILLIAAPLTLVGCSMLWIRGLNDQERGLSRGLFLFALAGALTEVGISITQFGKGFQAGWAQGAAPVPAPETPAGWSGMVDWVFLTALLAGLLHLLARHRGEAERQRRLAGAAQEAVLRAQLAPHFIFNCLNTLKAQIERDPAAAAAMTDRLASLFRQVVAVAERPTHPLRDELLFVETYLGIEQARLGDRLQVAIEVPEDLETREVLPLSLQVLVENAVKHGVGALEAGGRVRIRARAEGGALILSVEDPGGGAGEGSGTGTALAILRQRLGTSGDLALGQVDGRHCATLRWRAA